MDSYIFAAMFLLIPALVGLHAAGEWQPSIEGSYCTSSKALVVRISPPMAGAYDYYVCAQSKDNPSVFIDNYKPVNKSDTELVYKLEDIPTGEDQYVILVRAQDRHGDALTALMSSTNPVTVLSEVSGRVNKTTSTNWTTATRRPSAAVTTGFCSSSFSQTATVANSTNHHNMGFHIEKWVIVTGGVIVFFFVVFIVVMLYVGRGCRASRRRPSVRSHTSQMTTSETVCSTAEAQPFNSYHSRTPPLSHPSYTLTHIPLANSSGPSSRMREGMCQEDSQERVILTREGSLADVSVEVVA